jgi:hypothetical protein
MMQQLKEAGRKEFPLLVSRATCKVRWRPSPARCVKSATTRSRRASFTPASAASRNPTSRLPPPPKRW